MTMQAVATDKFVTVNGLRIHYVDWGNTGAMPLIMLHGLRSFARTWDGVATVWYDSHHVLALDQRGRGESDWAPNAEYRTEAYVSDLEQFVAQLGLERFILMGHSMGGANALAYASRHPERVVAAVIEDMGPQPASGPPPGAERITRELESTPAQFASLAEAEAFWRGQRPLISTEAMKDRLKQTLKELPDGRIVWKYDLEGIQQARQRAGVWGEDRWPQVRALLCPTLVLRGELSDILSRETAEGMAKANPRVRWVEVPRASHFVHEDNLEAFNREVARFLNQMG